MDAKMTLAEITTEDYRSAIVFKKYNMDFCCGGKKTLDTACEERNLNSSDVLEEIKLNATNSRPEQNYGDWKLDFLIAYIVNTQHIYVRKNLPAINEFLTKTVTKHGDNHPELKEIKQLFSQVRQELLSHMEKEEQILFPYIRQIVESEDFNKKLNPPMFGTIQNPIAMMEQEHIDAGNAFEAMRTLSNDFLPPQDACKTYKVTYSMLNEFEENLHLHIHLENNILFAKAIDLENKLLK